MIDIKLPKYTIELRRISGGTVWAAVESPDGDFYSVREVDAAVALNAIPDGWGRELVAAAQAVIERWDSPAWKDAPHTAIFINRMREAIDTALAASPTPQAKGEQE